MHACTYRYTCRYLYTLQASASLCLMFIFNNVFFSPQPACSIRATFDLALSLRRTAPHRTAPPYMHWYWYSACGHVSLRFASPRLTSPYMYKTYCTYIVYVQIHYTYTYIRTRTIRSYNILPNYHSSSLLFFATYVRRYVEYPLQYFQLSAHLALLFRQRFDERALPNFIVVSFTRISAAVQRSAAQQCSTDNEISISSSILTVASTSSSLSTRSDHVDLTYTKAMINVAIKCSIDAYTKHIMIKVTA